MRTPGPAAMTVLILLAAARASHGCSVPVFRYALERWPASHYRVTVLVHGEPTGRVASAIAAIEKRASGDSAANVAVASADPSGNLGDELKALWESQKKQAAETLAAGGAWAVVRYPEEDDVSAVVWSGPLADLDVAALVTSKAREETARRILAGQSAVWVIVEGSDSAANAKAEAMLTTEFQTLEKTIELPEQDPEDPRRMRSPLPLKVAFSVIRIARGAGEERLFSEMLLRSDERTARATGPAVFAVFGRGRAAPGLAGDDLTPEMVRRVAAFLTAECSCEIKQLNPGTDVLISANWDAIFDDPADAAASAERRGTPQPVPIPAGPDSGNSSDSATGQGDGSRSRGPRSPGALAGVSAALSAWSTSDRVALLGLCGAGIAAFVASAYILMARPARKS